MAAMTNNKNKARRRKTAIVALLALLAWAGWHATHRKTDTGVAERTATVETGSINALISAQGKLEPKDFVQVGLQITGQIKKLHVDVSDFVKKGDLLVEIDPRIYQSKVDVDHSQIKSLTAQLADQAAALELATLQQGRNQAMYRKKAISKDTFDQGAASLKSAKAKYDSLKAQIEQANSQLVADKTNLGFTKIYAPMDGVVASLPVREGQTLNSVQSAPTLMEIDNLDVMTVRAQVAEADVPHVTLGMPVYFTTLGDMEHKWRGTVRLIQPSPEVINDVVLYDVLIDTDNPGHKLLNGMSTQVFFELGAAENVPILSLEALGKRQPQEDADGAKAYSVQVKGEAAPRTVMVGLSDRTKAEIKSGLKAGDVVLVTPHAKPTGGQKTGGMPPGMGGPKL